MKIGVLGDVMLDTYIECDANRVSPEAPVIVGRKLHETYYPGGAANVANCIAGLGFNTVLIGAYSEHDEAGKELRTCMVDGVELINLQTSSTNTINKVRFVANNKHLFRFDVEPDKEKSSNYSTGTVISHLLKCDLVLLSDYNKGINKIYPDIIHHLRKNKIKTLVDCKLANIECYRGVDILKPNFREFVQICEFEGYSVELADLLRLSEDILPVMSEICKKYEIENLVITAGERGAFWYSHPTYELVHHSEPPVEIFDVAGAGDVFLSCLTYGIVHNYTMQQTLELAVRLATSSVSKKGTSCITLADLNDKESVVFTNGCFDIMHVGHLKYLQRSKNLGDKLIVGLNSDHSVRKLKGSKRPINNQIIRKEFLESLDFVDQVIVFDEETPLRLIEEIKPDIITKGGDYDPSDVVGKDFVESYGGKVAVINFEAGFSTTDIINRIIHE